MNSKLSFVENTLYFCIWTFACFYSLYELFIAQNDLLKNRPILTQDTLTELSPGWNFLPRLKDDSDGEWITWKILFSSTCIYMLMQFLISEIIRMTNNTILKYWYTISSIFFILIYLGIKSLAIVLVQPVIYWLIIYWGGKKKTIWLISLILLAGFNWTVYRDFIWYSLDTDDDTILHLLGFAIPWLELRCISFSIEYVDKMEKSQIPDQDTPVLNLLTMFSYVLYLPVFFFGPLILYEEFERSFHVKNENLQFRLKQFIGNMLIFLIYTLMLDLAFHYIYFLAMQTNLEAIEMLPSTALCGAGLWMGLTFHMKYFIVYGISSSYSRLDHIDAPPTPRCIARIHLYSQMWRYFDVGLYRFLFKYIHMPLYNMIRSNIKMSKLYCKLTSSLVTFIFIFVWHGATWSIFVWTLLNYIGIILEQIAKNIHETEQYRWFKKKILCTDAMEARFVAFLCAPMLCLSGISNFYLFADTDIGNLYFGLFYSPSWLKFTLAYLAFYSSCNVCVLLKDVPSRLDVRRDKKIV